jgi:nucleoside-diphosphate-sugar epimerase
MRILLIGGNGFIGRFVVTALQQQGHSVALFHRGTSVAPAGVEQILGDRDRFNASAAEMKRFAPEVVIDLVISSGPQAEEFMTLFRGAARRVVMLSSMDVYRAIGVAQDTEIGPLQEVPLTEDSELRRSLHPYTAEQLKMMRNLFSWVTDDYDKIPAERAVMNDPEVPAQSSGCLWCMDRVIRCIGLGLWSSALWTSGVRSFSPRRSLAGGRRGAT